MRRTLPVEVMPQPDESTCGPTCLHAVYRYFGESIALETVVAEAPTLEDGGTLAVLLGTHALGLGYAATVYSYNLRLLDPTWFRNGAVAVDLIRKLDAQAQLKRDPKRQLASHAYAEFARRGGELRMMDLSPELIAGYLEQGRPLLAGVSATYLYACARELPDGTYDDLAGEPQGHFVVLTGVRDDRVRVADPWQPSPDEPSSASLDPGEAARASRSYWLPMRHLLHSIMLGVLTYDGNLLAIAPKGAPALPGP